jgi:hypothetical protein
MDVDNTKYGRAIETSHQVIGLLDPVSAVHFNLADHTVEKPCGMDEIITPSDAAGMHRQAVQFMKAQNEDISQTVGACHSSPMAGHSSVDRTYHRVITRFWWPGVSRDVRNGVLGCACCRLANHTDHENQQLLYSFVCDEPFSVIFLDIWQPGEILEKDGSFAVLTMLEGMCGFAGAAFLPKRITSETMADATFSTFIPHFGLP